MTCEAEEELGVPADKVLSGFQIAYYKIGNVLNGVPRMNIFYKASVPIELIQKTDDVTKWGWFTKDEPMQLNVNPSYDKVKLAGIAFGG